MKKILSSVIALSLSVAIAAPAFAYSFTDISGDSYAWAAEYIENMYNDGYITGYEDGTFRPDNEVTRLECLALFSRAMGAKEDENKSILELAHSDYDNLIGNYGLSWGQDEIAYLLYKGVLKKSDLDTYLIGREKDTPMKRFEAAIIITKALGGEAEALSQTSVVLDYTDAKDIPANSVQYVNYASKAEIMNGMDGGAFSPNSSVSRAQMAVMLSRTVDKTEYSFVKAKLMSVSENDRNVVYKDAAGTEKRLVYTDNTVMRVLGTVTQPRIMTTGVQAVFTLSGDELVSVDTLSDKPDETVTGVFKGYTNSGGKMFLQVAVDNTTKSYECSADVSITYAGSPATVRAFASGDSIELSMVDGKVVSVIGNEKVVEIKNATVEEVIVDNVVQIKISSAAPEYNGKTYEVSSEVIVKKNNVDSELSKIYKGDTVTLTVQYGVIKKIVANASTKIIDATITKVVIANPNSSLFVNVNGKEVEYFVPASVEININGKEATLYDFRVGDAIKITTESNAVTKIVATAAQVTEGEIKGVVTGVNASYGFISILDENGITSQVLCKDTTTTFITKGGEKKNMAYIKDGMKVEAMGTIKSGALMATLVIINE